MTLSCYIPLYIYPNWWTGIPYNWTPVINAIANNPTLQFVIVLNINSGPDTTLNTDYVHGITDLRNAALAADNLTILGYVFTSYGARLIADVKTDIDRWKNFYSPNIDGIHLDEMANITGKESYYTEITDYVKTTVGLSAVWANPGNPTISSYINTVDTLIIFEGATAPTLSTLAASTFYPNYPKSKFALNIFGQATLDTQYIQNLDAAAYIGHIHYTDDTLPNPYDVFATYLNNLVSLLVSLPPDTILPPPEPVKSWYVVNHSPAGDFTEPVEDMLRTYLKNNWGATGPISPLKSTNPPLDLKNKIKFSDVEYDYLSTYYIRVKEADTAIDNEMILNSGCFLMKTAVNIDLTARRLTYGEHFKEMNNMRLEVIRILGNYRPDDISGIQMIEMETPGERDIETRNYESASKLPKTIWYLRIKAICHYIKAYECIV